MSRTQVLIVGAGPTGLMLALWLARLGVSVRIIDKTDAPGTTSRAIVVHARNLEFYRQLGIVDVALRDGLKWDAAVLWVNGHRAGSIDFGDLGDVASPYPFMLIFPQDLDEQLLIDELMQLGVPVDRETELIAVEHAEQGVSARLRKNGVEEVCEAAYLAGCDGAHSAVRTQLGIGFSGERYSDIFYVADVVADGPAVSGEMHGVLDEADFLAVFPMKGPGRLRLVGSVGDDTADRKLTWEDVSPRILDNLRTKVTDVRWFSTYHVDHRVAAAFRQGPAFLLGDAAHVHSPVGGQGMNTGLGDAVNLAWKLAAVLQGRADASLLDTYEPERIAFARKLVATTDKGFTFVTARGGLAKLLRTKLAPLILPALSRIRAVRRLMFRTLSQLSIRYPDSALSEGSTGRLAAGDRLPWTGNLDIDNFVPLAALDWQIHVYGQASDALRGLSQTKLPALHEFAWSSGMEQLGLKRDAAYLIRPDGYVGFADVGAKPTELSAYLDTWSIRPRETKDRR